MSKERINLLFAFRILRWFCPAPLYEEIEGDLIQKFNRDVKSMGEKKAKQRLLWNTLRFFRPGIVLRNNFSVELNFGYMIINNLRFTFRHLRRQKINSFLHVFGLTMGMYVCLLIGLFIRYELSFDSFHPRAENIYRITSTFSEAGVKFNIYGTPIPLAETIRNEITGIEKSAMTRALFKTVVEISPQKIFKQEHALIVEPGFLDIFHVELIHGDANNALQSPYQALLTESVAKKFFGNDDPIGKTFKYNSKFIITVTGIVRDFPSQTHLPASMLLSYVNNNEFLDNGDTWYFGDFPWTKLSASTYVMLQENYDPKDFELQLKKLADKNINSAPTLDKKIRGDFNVQPLKDIHFDMDHGGGPWTRATDQSWLWFFGGLGIVVLVMACINFLNLSTAQAYARAKEVGVRKSIGAQRGQLIIQFLGEAFVLVLVSSVISIIAAYLSLDSINTLLEKNITFQPFGSLPLMVSLFLGILLTALLAGLYPAWIIAKFSPLKTLTSASAVAGTSWLRKGLVITQFTVSAGLFMVVLLMAQQVSYLRGKDPGFEKDNIVTVYAVDPANAKEFVHELSQIPAVKDISLSRSTPISDDQWWNTISLTETGDRHTVCALYSDDRFYSLFNLRLLSGRILKMDEYIPDSLREDGYISKVVVNEKLLTMLALGSPDEAIGKHIWWGSDTQIIGVVADFNTSPLKYEVSPTILTQDPSIHNQANIKIVKGDNLLQTLAAIESSWKKTFPHGVFEFKFFDAQIDSFYKAEDKLYFLFKIFAVIAISISCVGLWGLVAFVTQRRTKEIGIRKVMGASVNAIVLLLSQDFLLMVAIGFGLASPLSYYFMTDWLKSFAYHIDIGWQIFMITGLILTVVTISTVSFQTLKAALANPVKSLQSE